MLRFTHLLSLEQELSSRVVLMPMIKSEVSS